MEHPHENSANGALSAAENELIALIAMIAVEQAIAEASQNSRIEQGGRAA